MLNEESINYQKAISVLVELQKVEKGDEEDLTSKDFVLTSNV